MINTTLCYIRRGDDYLMLHRIKKKNDLNQDKWIGIGGKFEDKESPEDCLLREVREETSATFLAARTHWVDEPREVEIRGETYYSVEKTAGDAWTLPWPWLADWAEGLCRRTAGTEWDSAYTLL